MRLTDTLHPTTEKLVTLARGGSDAAFAELVRRYRGKAFAWASGMAGDSHSAEDIVQEALLKVYLRLDSLADPVRFSSWLHAIIKNQARMKARKSFRKRERLADGAALDDASESMMNAAGGDERALEALSDAAGAARKLMGCLSANERAVFADHYLEQLSPAEIAYRHGVSADSIYHSLSRARSKLQQESKRQELVEYVRDRLTVKAEARMMADGGSKKGRSLWKLGKNSLACALYYRLQASGKSEYDLSDVMGLTGQAFRLTVEADTTDASGPWMYFWEPVVQEALTQLGMTSRITGDGGAAPSPFMLHKSLEHIRDTVSAGSPVIAWGMFTAGFGVITGYDDEQMLLYAEDARKKRAIPYESLGRGASDGLFVVSSEPMAAVSDQRMLLKKALQLAIRHAYRERTFVGYISGIAGYDSWKAALAHGKADALGNAYCAELTADARRHGAVFLQRTAGRFAAEPIVAGLAEEASGRMLEAARLLERLSEMFPFPHGGNPHDAGNAEEAIGLLEAAKRQEEEAYERFGLMIRYLSRQPNEER